MPTAYSAEHTKKLLAASLKKLMAVKPFNKITVREVVDDCGLNRQTFYYHFQDLPDLAKWMFEQEVVILLQVQKDILTWEDGVLQLFNYLETNRAVCLCAFHSLGHEQLKRLVYADSHAFLKKVVEHLAVGLEVDEAYQDFVAHFYTVAIAGLAESWLLTPSSQQMSPEEMLALINLTIGDNIRNALERYVQAHKGRVKKELTKH